MKKIFSNNRLIAISFFTVFTTAMAPAVQASPFPPVSAVELKYLGIQQNQPMFQLQVNGGAHDEAYTIIIRDEYNNSLYREKIIGGSFTKTFLFNRDEIGNDQVRFEVWCEKSKEKFVYLINQQTRMVEDTWVNQIK